VNEPSQSEEVIFGHAVDLPLAERVVYLVQACGGDAALRSRVEALLRAHVEAGDLLESAPGVTVRAALSTSQSDEKPGNLIGRYKLLQKIGEGGCGVVYMAEQQAPVVRRVALKVIKLGMDTKEVIARFEAERQALAMMDHPNIARVFDAGATETGRPYFVMELVRGVKITDYCDQQNLSTVERLGLFIQVCHAIQHAHQKGIIHRDIKPSNILVTLQDGEPMPKVIDFGIAKATQGRLTDRTLFTAYEQFIGTPPYMSPEQAQLSNQDVDTRTDIYSLGVLLYELLTGQTPFETKNLLKAGVDEIRRQIREVEPPKPSTRLRTLEAGALTTTASHRATPALRLIHLVRGDLDWIVMRCLEKDRRRRYETANGLAQDLVHFLADEPVLAAAPGAWYRVQKLTRRHRTLVFVAIGFVFALITVAVVSTGLAFRSSRLERVATEARIRAEAASQTARESAAVSLEAEDFLRVYLLSAGGGAKDEATLCNRLDRAAAELHVQPPANGLVEIAIRENLAAGYRSLGLHTSLQDQLTRIMELHRLQREPADRPPIPAPKAAQSAIVGNEPLMQSLEINLGTLLPRGTTQERLLLRMAESWHDATNGKITLKIVGDGRVSSDSEIVSMVKNRRLQAAFMTAIGLEEIDSAVVGLQKNPLAFSSLTELDFVSERLTSMLEARLQRKGLTVLFLMDAGWLQFFSRRPVESPNDLYDLRVFMWAGRPAHLELMRAAGFNPVPLESGDYIPAFRNGLIDAGELPPFLALSYQIDSYASHMLVMNSEPLIGACVIRSETWESIPVETREHLLEISRATGREITASARRDSDAAVEVMQKRGLTVHTIPTAKATEWRVMADKFRSFPRGRVVDPAIFDRIQALIAEYRATHRNESSAP